MKKLQFFYLLFILKYVIIINSICSYRNKIIFLQNKIISFVLYKNLSVWTFSSDMKYFRNIFYTFNYLFEIRYHA